MRLWQILPPTHNFTTSSNHPTVSLSQFSPTSSFTHPSGVKDYLGSLGSHSTEINNPSFVAEWDPKNNLTHVSVALAKVRHTHYKDWLPVEYSCFCQLVVKVEQGSPTAGPQTTSCPWNVSSWPHNPP